MPASGASRPTDRARCSRDGPPGVARMAAACAGDTPPLITTSGQSRPTANSNTLTICSAAASAAAADAAGKAGAYTSVQRARPAACAAALILAASSQLASPSARCATEAAPQARNPAGGA